MRAQRLLWAGYGLFALQVVLFTAAFPLMWMGVALRMRERGRA